MNTKEFRWLHVNVGSGERLVPSGAHFTNMV